MYSISPSRLLCVGVFLYSFRMRYNLSKLNNQNYQTLMRYVCNHCVQAAEMVWIAPVCWDYQIDLSFAIQEQFIYCLILTLFLSNFAKLLQKIDYFVLFLGRFWHYLAWFNPVFCIKFSKIGKSQNGKNIELPKH